MKYLMIMAAAVLGASLLAVQAQTTNAPQTDIEMLELQPDGIIVKGFGPAGSVSVGQGILSVRVKESFNVDTGGKLEGLVVDFTEGGHRERAVIDYEEVAPLIKGLDYIQSVTYDVTKLSGFEAAFQTKSGCRVSAFGSQRHTAIQTFIQFEAAPKIELNSDQIAQFRNVIAQGLDMLNGLRTPK
jgi:hypothetical protein